MGRFDWKIWLLMLVVIFIIAIFLVFSVRPTTPTYVPCLSCQKQKTAMYASSALNALCESGSWCNHAIHVSSRP